MFNRKKIKRINLHILIKKLNNHINFFSSTTEREACYQVLMRLEALVHVHKHWLEGDGGIIWRHEKLALTLNKTQEKKVDASATTPQHLTLNQKILNQEMVKAEQDSANFIKTVLENLQSNLLSNPETKVPGIFDKFKIENPRKADKIINEINEAIQAIFVQLKKYPVNDRQYKATDYAVSLLYDAAVQNGARYLRCQQSTDPLRGTKTQDGKDYPGDCHGHAALQGKLIITNGKGSIFQRVDDIVFHRQDNQFQTNWINVSAETSKETSAIIDDVLTHISPRFTYGLSSGDHSVFIRKIPSTDEIEFQDSNYGKFVFPNAKKFKAWFSENYSIWFKIKTCYQFFKQPPTATATIPAFAVEKATDSKPIHSYLKPEDRFSSPASWMDFHQSYLHTVARSEEFEGRSTHMFRFLEKRQAELSVLVDKKNDKPFFGMCNLFEIQFRVRQINSVCAAIDRTIARLKETCHASSPALKNKIHAFQELKRRIRHSSDTDTLTLIVEQWLDDKNQQGQNYKTILEEKPSKSNFLKNLLKHYEINTGLILINQDKVILTLRLIFKDYFDRDEAIENNAFNDRLRQIHAILKELDPIDLESGAMMLAKISKFSNGRRGLCHFFDRSSGCIVLNELQRLSKLLNKTYDISALQTAFNRLQELSKMAVFNVAPTPPTTPLVRS